MAEPPSSDLVYIYIGLHRKLPHRLYLKNCRKSTHLNPGHPWFRRFRQLCGGRDPGDRGEGNQWDTNVIEYHEFLALTELRGQSITLSLFGIIFFFVFFFEVELM